MKSNATKSQEKFVQRLKMKPTATTMQDASGSWVKVLVPDVGVRRVLRKFARTFENKNTKSGVAQ
jgi:hypothetical protein